jgi:hypothetical protein
VSHANERRTAAGGSFDRWNINSDDSEVVELYRRNLSDRDRHLGVGTDVMPFFRSDKYSKKAKINFAERRT